VHQSLREVFAPLIRILQIRTGFQLLTYGIFSVLILSRGVHGSHGEQIEDE
jgi:hypothetical protein